MDDLDAAFEALRAQRSSDGNAKTKKAGKAVAGPPVRAQEPKRRDKSGVQQRARADQPEVPPSRGKTPAAPTRPAPDVRNGGKGQLPANQLLPTPVGERKASAAEKKARRAIERQQPISDSPYDPPLPPATAAEAPGRTFGYKGAQPPAFVKNLRTTADYPKKYGPGALKEGDSVWYRDKRYWICWAPDTWEFTSFIRLIDEPWRPGGNTSKTAELVNVHADLVEPAPVKGPAFAPQPTKHAIETKQRMKQQGITHVGDDVGAMLQGKTLDEAYGVAAEYLGIPEAELRAKYGKLNPGQQRMNLGNRMRGAAKKRG